MAAAQARECAYRELALPLNHDVPFGGQGGS